MKQPTSCLPTSPGLPESSGRALMTTTPRYLTHTTTSMAGSPTIRSGGSWGNTTRCGSTSSRWTCSKWHSHQNSDRWWHNRNRRPSPLRECTRWLPRHKENSRARVRPSLTKLERKKVPPKVRSMTSRLSTDQEPGPKATNPADKTEETTAPDEEATKLDQEDEEEIPALEATATGTANTATSAKSRDTDKKNAGSESRRINPAVTLKDDTTGPRFTSWKRTKPRPSMPLIRKRSDLPKGTAHLILPDSPLKQGPQPLPRNSRVFSKDLDDSPHPSS